MHSESHNGVPEMNSVGKSQFVGPCQRSLFRDSWVDFVILHSCPRSIGFFFAIGLFFRGGGRRKEGVKIAPSPAEEAFRCALAPVRNTQTVATSPLASVGLGASMR